MKQMPGVLLVLARLNDWHVLHRICSEMALAALTHVNVVHISETTGRVELILAE